MLAVLFSCGGDGPSAPPPVANTITANSSTTLSGTAGVAVVTLPSVLVRDQNGNPMSGTSVIFAVGAGGGTVTGGSQVTNSSGVATVGGWTLGAAGTNTLTATAGNLPAVTFTVTATDPCAVSAPHTIGSTTNGALTTSDCRLTDGSYVDFYTTSVATAAAYLFNQASTAFDTFLTLLSSAGFVIAVNDDSGSTTNSTIKVLLPAASYTLAATSFAPSATGSYTLSSAATSAAITGCEEVFVARGISTTQDLQTTDCANGGFYSDDVLIFLRAGQTVTIDMSSTAMDASLKLYGASGLVASNDDRDSTTTDARIVYTVTADALYLIVPTSFAAGSTGAYTLIIQ